MACRRAPARAARARAGLAALAALAIVGSSGCARPSPPTSAQARRAPAPPTPEVSPTRGEPAREAWRAFVPVRCRDEAGAARAGCPARRVVTTATSIEIFDDIQFVDNTAELAPRSQRTITAIASALLGNPSLLVIEVRGHSDSQLHPVERAEVARRRAEVVAGALIAAGVPRDRLTTYGASDGEPRYPADDPRNRRVELLILDRGADPDD
jgi:outer membrane protein OmpA-like peptidoglycan-associated protein